MKRVKISLWMLGVALAVSAAILLLPGVTMSSLPTETPARVELAQVVIGDVEQVLAVTGRLRYESEYAVLAPSAGMVEQVCVKAGDRVEEGQALFRLSSSAQEKALSALLGLQEAEASAALMQAASLMESMTVRAPAPGAVHQVAVTEHGGITAGMPAVTLSTGRQQVMCSVVMSDAVNVAEGMEARIFLQEELLCSARVSSVGALETDLTTGQTVSQVTLGLEENLALPLGAALDVEIILAAQNDVPVLPVEALDENGEVWWVAEGRCYRTQAGVVMADEMLAWVTLPEGEHVVLSSDVVEGQRVREVKP